MKVYCKDKDYYSPRFKGERILRDTTEFMDSGLKKLRNLIADGKCFYLAYIDIDNDERYTIQLEMILADIIGRVCSSVDSLQLTAWHVLRDDFLILSYSRKIIEVCHSILESWLDHVYSQSQIIVGNNKIPGGLGLSIAILRHEQGYFLDFDHYETKLYSLLRDAKKHKGCKYLVQEANDLTLKTITTNRKQNI